MDISVLKATADQMVAPGKGILAMDESHPTCNKRFEALGIETSEENRRAYRTMLVTTEDLAKYISGAILFDETIRQKMSSEDKLFAQYLNDIGIIPGIKVDQGAKEFVDHPGEKLTAGLDGLSERLNEYAKLGARFAKWRAVITIGDGIPTQECIDANASALAMYAKMCQEQNIVPIVEPEVLMDGDHTIERCYEVTENTQKEVFSQLEKEGVFTEGIVLKPNMILPGTESKQTCTVSTVAEMTLKCLTSTVPSTVPGIAFLSGGQSDQEATEHLNEINRLAVVQKAPWKLTFSYGRALQQDAMKTWGGRAEQTASAQQVAQHRARLNGLASSGDYQSE